MCDDNHTTSKELERGLDAWCLRPKHSYINMGFGRRVRITRPPPGKPEWENRTATVLALVPVAKVDLEYRIRLDDDGAEYTVAATCLEPLTIEEEEEDSDDDGYLIVNNLMYCRQHRLEVCGSCGVDHRMTNYSTELNNRVGFEFVDSLIDDMRLLGAPPRRAPRNKSKSSSPLANKAPFHPVVDDHLLLIQQGFNPSWLDEWFLGPTYPAATVATAFGPEESSVPEVAKLPVRRMRETIVIAAKRWDDALKSLRSPGINEPMPRLMLQDKAQTQILSMDLAPPVRMQKVGGRPVPVFVVRWAHCMATNMQDAFAVLGTMEPNTSMGEIPVQTDEIELMAALLSGN